MPPRVTLDMSAAITPLNKRVPLMVANVVASYVLLRPLSWVMVKGFGVILAESPIG